MSRRLLGGGGHGPGGDRPGHRLADSCAGPARPGHSSCHCHHCQPCSSTGEQPLDASLSGAPVEGCLPGRGGQGRLRRDLPGPGGCTCSIGLGCWGQGGSWGLWGPRSPREATVSSCSLTSPQETACPVLSCPPALNAQSSVASLSVCPSSTPSLTVLHDPCPSCLWSSQAIRRLPGKDRACGSVQVPSLLAFSTRQVAVPRAPHVPPQLLLRRELLGPGLGFIPGASLEGPCALQGVTFPEDPDPAAPAPTCPWAAQLTWGCGAWLRTSHQPWRGCVALQSAACPCSGAVWRTHRTSRSSVLTPVGPASSLGVAPAPPWAPDLTLRSQWLQCPQQPSQGQPC